MSGPCFPASSATSGSSSSTLGRRRRPAQGPGPVASYLEELTEVDPGDVPVVLPPLVTVIGRKVGAAGAAAAGAPAPDRSPTRR